MRVFLAIVAVGMVPYFPQSVEPLPLEQTLKKAQVGGKYRMLLKMLKVPDAIKEYTAFKDYGYSTQSEIDDYKDLPKGFWVYVYPYWFIWRDKPTGQEQKRQWGSEQATGKPDTPEPGDFPTAWASASQDDGPEWLMLEYKTPSTPTSVRIYETYNPGAVVRITAFTLDDREVEVWHRSRPVIPGSPGFVFRPGFDRKVLTNRIKLYLDSKAVPGWNEIDAVGLYDSSEGLQWATAAHASSNYGSVKD